MSLCTDLSMDQSVMLYREILLDNDEDCMRKLCQEDLFFLMTIALKRQDMIKPWLYDRCREVEAAPNQHLDLWAREHYKSTIITFGLSIKDILADPNVTIGIFSHTRPIAKAFLSQIKVELETNEFLQSLFPNVLYKNPQRESVRWSLDNGIIVKRSNNPKESTVEAWGLVDGQPTSKHFNILVYDDVVTRESVTSPEMMLKTTMAWELSTNLGAHGGCERYIGTRYHFNDTYKTMLDREIATPRIYPATADGTPNGKPVFLSKESLDDKRRKQGPYTFGCQMLQNPVADNAMGFKKEWLRYYNPVGEGRQSYSRKWNYYILVDPAGSKKKNSDYTVMWVMGLGPDGNYYIVDGVRDRLNLTERANKLFELVVKYKPLKVGYEKYGIMADIEHIKYEMEHRNYRFSIEAVGGNTLSKEDRIRALIPLFEQGRLFMPNELLKMDSDGRLVNLTAKFVSDEYEAFPVSKHDDMLDCMSRIMDPAFGAMHPKIRRAENNYVKKEYKPFARRR